MNTDIDKAKFLLGEKIHHKRFDYRGVIASVDYKFKGGEEWYESVAKSRPPKHKPWYHVLVHEHIHTTYVAEQNLEADDNDDPILHPLMGNVFKGFENGRYIRKDRPN